MKYVEPLNSAAYPERNGQYITANPAISLKGSTVPAESIEHPMREIVHVIEMAGLVPSPADLTQLYQAILLLYPEVEGFLPLAGGTMEGSILAKTDNVISIGSAIKRFKEFFAVRFRGIADSADKLETARKINGVDFDATQDITIPIHTAVLKTENGYISLYGSGLIIQWGRLYFGSGTGPFTATFPIEFPNACLLPVATPNGNWNNGGSYTWINIRSWTKTTASIRCEIESGSQGYINWIAIGH